MKQKSAGSYLIHSLDFFRSKRILFIGLVRGVHSREGTFSVEFGLFARKSTRLEV